MDTFFLVVATMPNRPSHLDENGKVITPPHRFLQMRRGMNFDNSVVVQEEPIPHKASEAALLHKKMKSEADTKNK